MFFAIRPTCRLAILPWPIMIIMMIIIIMIMIIIKIIMK